MKIPQIVNSNTYLCYKSDGSLNSNRKLKSDDFNWDLNHPKTLISLCIHQLSCSWTGTPSLDELVAKDRDQFLSLLDIDVPLKILVDNIKSDIFWKKNFISKWKDVPLAIEDKKWLNIFMERYYAQYLETLNPKDYDPEMVKNLVKICGPFIQSLSIRSLLPSDIPIQRAVSPEMAELISGQPELIFKPQIRSNETITRDHISLHAALGSLTNLVELHVTYQLLGSGVEFRKDQFQFTVNDAKNLARGLEKCGKLKILKITRSDMDCQKIKYVLRGISDNQNIEAIDFSHCKIGDEGTTCLMKFINKHDNLRQLILADNVFGPLGAENISQALIRNGCGIRYLDLRLNTKLGPEGIAHIAIAIARGCNLTFLNISGCGIKPGPLSKVPPGIWSTTTAESPPTCGDLLARAIGLAKTPLRSLDISVNNIGSPSDNALSNAICLSYIIDVHLKRSGMSSVSMAIAESAAAAQKLRRDSERGLRFRRSAGRVVQARRVAKGMNIDADPILLAQQLSARPSVVSITSEEGCIYSIATQPLPTDFGFIPAFKGPLPSSRNSSISGPPTSRRSSHHGVTEPDKVYMKSVLVRRSSDGSLIQTRTNDPPKHIKIYVSHEIDKSRY